RRQNTMKRICVTRGCGASGVSLRPGEIAEVSDDDARILIALGKAKPAELSDEPDLAEPQGLTTETAAAIVDKPKKAARGEKPAA
ncbi:MAG: hypothetical protein ACREU9_11140, partial [Gammaproteobacteria bacterium]